MAEFLPALTYVLANEGSQFTETPDDAGGATKYGVSQKALQNYRNKKSPRAIAVTRDDVRALTLAEASLIYREDYWQKVQGDALQSDALATCLFDAAVNCGPGTVAKRAQTILNARGATLPVDGLLGPKTAAALNGVAATVFVPALVQVQLAAYVALVQARPSQRPFFRGWSRRATAYLETIL